MGAGRGGAAVPDGRGSGGDAPGDSCQRQSDSLASELPACPAGGSAGGHLGALGTHRSLGSQRSAPRPITPYVRELGPRWRRDLSDESAELRVSPKVLVDDQGMVRLTDSSLQTTQRVLIGG